MKYLIVVNAVILNNGTKISRDSIKAAFKDADYDIYETEPNRKTVSFVDKYLKDNKDTTVRIFACGGDGTVNEVVNGMVNHKNAELAIYPIGTGNDFVKIYGGASKFLDLKSLIKLPTKEIDISKIEGSTLKNKWYSINVVNFGFDAIVGAMGNYYKTNGYPEKAKAKGMSPYDYALKNDAMKRGRYNLIEVYADGEKLNEKQMLLCTLAQGQFVGGQFHCAPKSKNDDGLIDVCLLKTMPLISFGMIIKPYTAGKHLNKPNRKIIYRQSKEVKIVAPDEIDLCIDGEMVRGKEFTVTSVPKAIKLVIPE